MKYQHADKTTWFVLGLTAISLSASPSPGLAASPSADHPAPVSSIHSHEVMQQTPRLLPKRVVTVTGNEDWDLQRGFGKDAAMAEMMTLMMVGGSGMEHMRMAPMKRGGMAMAGMGMGAMATGAAGEADRPKRLNVSATLSPNPPAVGANMLDIVVTDANGKPVTGLKLATSVAMTSMDMGTEHPQVIEGPAGHYITMVSFSMSGPWRVMLAGSVPGADPTGAVRAALDFNVGSTQKWGQERSAPSFAGYPPASRAPGGAASKVAQSAGPNVTLNTPPSAVKVGKNPLEFTILDDAGKPVTGAKVTTAVARTSMDMGTTHPQAKEGKDGHYTTEAEFSMKGPWRVTVHVAPPSQKPFTRAFDLNVTR
jgi:hypothetical protein